MSRDAPTPVSASRRPGPELRDYAGAELDRAIACLGWRGGRLHAGIHQGRKSLRRTRAVLALGAAALGPGRDLVDREIRRINRSLSTLRDTQATVETLDRLIRSRHGDAATPMLRRARRKAARRRAEHRRALSVDAALETPRALLATLRAALVALPWDKVDEDTLAAAVAFSTARIEAAGARVRERGRDTDWHRWRRRVRRLSQQQRALERAAPALVVAKKRWKSLAVMLGEVQDFGLLLEQCGKRSPFGAGDRRLLRALAESAQGGARERIRPPEETPAEPPPSVSIG